MLRVRKGGKFYKKAVFQIKNVPRFSTQYEKHCYLREIYQKPAKQDL